MASFPPEPRSSAGEALPACQRGYRLVWGVCILLTVLVWSVFGQTLNHEFVNYDDNSYVYDNALVKKGLSADGIRQAFTHRELGLWNPLNTLSHMADVQLYGLKPAGHHFTNVLLHLASVLLLFLILRQATGSLWRSAFVAAVFAIHPLRVESVAWISERKDVLSALFFMLTLGAYLHYLKQQRSLFRYAILIVFFALGLMSKPMLMTLPFVLLLIDYWPLNRLFHSLPTGKNNINWPVVWEKLPLLALAAALPFSFLLGPPGEGSDEITPFAIRLAQMPLAFLAYLRQMIWPSGFNLIYAQPEINFFGVFLCLLLMIGLTLAVFIFRKKYPYLLMGWLWNLGMLVPVLGIIQISRHWQADHYTYLPQIGIYIMIAWGVADLSRRWHRRGLVLGIFSAIVLGALVFQARAQTVYWQNSYLLWTHMLAGGEANEIAHNNLAMTLREKGDTDGAIQHYEEALILKPDYTEAHYNLANMLRQKGNVDEAIGHYEKALAADPRFAKAHNNLGNALLREGKLDEAIGHYEKALALKPAFAEAQFNLGSALLMKGRVDEAIGHYQKALEIEPDDVEVRRQLADLLLQQGILDEAIENFQKVLKMQPFNPETHNNLAIAFYQKGRIVEAIDLYKKTVELAPDYVEARNNLAWLLAATSEISLRDGKLAETHARKANELSGGKVPMILRTLAAALAEEGNFSEAVKVARNALGLAKAQSDKPVVEMLEREIRLYQAGSSFREEGIEGK